MSTWTTEKPKVPGWYWWRDTQAKYEEDREPHIYKVRMYCGQLSIGNCTIDDSHFVKRGEWAGPLEVPT